MYLYHPHLFEINMQCGHLKNVFVYSYYNYIIYYLAKPFSMGISVCKSGLLTDAG